MRVKEYIVKGYDENNDVVFCRKGRFYENEDALNHFYQRVNSFKPLKNVVNLAFNLSGGLTKNFVRDFKVCRVELINTTDNEIHSRAVQNIGGEV